MGKVKVGGLKLKPKKWKKSSFYPLVIKIVGGVIAAIIVWFITNYVLNAVFAP